MTEEERRRLLGQSPSNINQLLGLGGSAAVVNANPNARVAPARPQNRGTIGIGQSPQATARVVQQTRQQQIQSLLQPQTAKLQSQIAQQNQKNAQFLQSLFGNKPLDLFNIKPGTTFGVDKRNPFQQSLDRLREVTKQGVGADEFINSILDQEKERRSVELQQALNNQLSPPGQEVNPDDKIIIGETDEQKKAREDAGKKKSEDEERVRQQLEKQVADADAEIRKSLANPNDTRESGQIVQEAYGKVDPQAIIYAGQKAAEKRVQTDATYKQKVEEQKKQKANEGSPLQKLLRGNWKGALGASLEFGAFDDPTAGETGKAENWLGGSLSQRLAAQKADRESGSGQLYFPGTGGGIKTVGKGVAETVAKKTAQNLKNAPVRTESIGTSTFGEVVVPKATRKSSLKQGNILARNTGSTAKNTGGIATPNDTIVQRALGDEALQLEDAKIFHQQMAADFNRTAKQALQNKVLQPIKDFDRQFAGRFNPAEQFVKTRNPSVLKDLTDAQRKQVRQIARNYQKGVDDLYHLADEAGTKLRNKSLARRKNYVVVGERKNKLQQVFGELSSPSGIVDDVGGPGAKPSYRFAKTANNKDGDLAIGLDNYIDDLTREMYLAPIAARYEGAAGTLLARQQKGGKDLSKVIRTLTNTSEGLKGTGKLQLPGGFSVNGGESRSRVIRALNVLLAQNSANSLGFNPSSILVQTIGGAKAIGREPLSALKVLAGRGEKNAIPSRFLGAYTEKGVRLGESGYGKARDAGFEPLRKVVQGTGSFADKVYTTAAKNKGLTNEQARRLVDRRIKQDIASRLPGDRAAAFNIPGLNLFTQFGLEPSNDLTQFGTLARQSLKGKNKGKAATELAGLAAALYGYNSLFEKATGYRPAFDPINTSIATGQELAQGDPLGAAGQLAGGTVSNRPGGTQALGAVASLLGAKTDEERKAIFGDSQFGRYGAGVPLQSILRGFNFHIQDGKLQADVPQGLLELGARTLPPTGGSEALKLLEAGKTLASGKYTTRSGNELGVTIDQSPLAQLQTLLFGKGANPGVQKYFKQVNETGNFPTSDRQLEGAKQRIDELKAAAGPAGKYINFSEDDLKRLAVVTGEDSMELISNKDKLKALLSGDDEQIRKQFGNKDVKKLKDAFGSEDGKQTVAKLMRLQSSGDKVLAKQSDLDQKYNNGDIGNVEYAVESAKNRDEKNIDQNIFNPDALNQKDINYLRGKMSDDEVQDYMRQLRNSGRGDLADQILQALNSYVDTAAQMGSTKFRTPVKVYTSKQQTQELDLASRATAEAIDLAKASNDDRANIIKNNPALAASLPGALAYQQSRASAGLIKQSSVNSLNKQLQKLLNGDFSAGDNTALKGGSGRKSGGRKRGGSKGRKPKKMSVKKPRAGKKASIKKPKSVPFSIPKPKKKPLTFDQILKQLQ